MVPPGGCATVTVRSSKVLKVKFLLWPIWTNFWVNLGAMNCFPLRAACRQGRNGFQLLAWLCLEHARTQLGTYGVIAVESKITTWERIILGDSSSVYQPFSRWRPQNKRTCNASHPTPYSTAADSIPKNFKPSLSFAFGWLYQMQTGS